jgi:hypothetical protein
MLRFRLHEEVPNIVQLQVHLENEQSVVYRDGELVEDVLNRAQDTTLTGFFKLNTHQNEAI